MICKRCSKNIIGINKCLYCGFEIQECASGEDISEEIDYSSIIIAETILVPDKQDKKTLKSFVIKSFYGIAFIIFGILGPIVGLLQFRITQNNLFLVMAITYGFLGIIFPTLLPSVIALDCIRTSEQLEPLRNEISTQRKIICEGIAKKYDGKLPNKEKLFISHWMFLTEATLEYYPVILRMRSKGALAIMLEDVTEVHSAGENYMFVKTKDGEKHEFFVWRAYIWEAKIKELIKANESSSF